MPAAVGSTSPKPPSGSARMSSRRARAEIAARDGLRTDPAFAGDAVHVPDRQLLPVREHAASAGPVASMLRCRDLIDVADQHQIVVRQIVHGRGEKRPLTPLVLPWIRVRFGSVDQVDYAIFPATEPRGILRVHQRFRNAAKRKRRLAQDEAVHDTVENGEP